MTIRPATRDDVELVLPMVERISALHRDWDAVRFDVRPDVAEMYRGWLSRIAGGGDDAVFLVAEREPGKLVGYAVGTVEESIPIYWVPACGYLHDVWVEADYRHEGVGRRLVQEAVERFRQLGVTQVRLETAAANDAGRAMFARCGFRPATVEMLCELPPDATGDR